MGSCPQAPHLFLPDALLPNITTQVPAECQASSVPGFLPDLCPHTAPEVPCLRDTGSLRSLEVMGGLCCDPLI